MRDGQVNAVARHMQRCNSVHRLSSVTNPMPCAIARPTGLPAFEAGDVKLSVSRIEPAAHDSGIKLQRKLVYAPLDLAIDLFHQHVEERALPVGGVKEV